MKLFLATIPRQTALRPKALRQKFSWWQLLLPLCILTLFSHRVDAAVQLPTLRWCLDHFPRFHEFQRGDEVSGPSVEVMEHLAKRAGFTLQYSPRTPLARCFRQMAQGEADLMINLNHTPERAQWMFLFPYSENIPETLYQRAADLRHIDQLSQLTPLVLVTVRNYSYNPTLMTLITNQKRQHIEVDSIFAGFQLLQKGRVDGLILPTQSSLDVIRKHPQLHYQFRKAPLTFKFSEKRYVNIGLSRLSKHLYLKETIARTIEQMMADGTIHRLYQQHLPEETDYLANDHSTSLHVR